MLPRRLLTSAVAALAMTAPVALGDVTVWQGSMAGWRGTSGDVTARVVARVSLGGTHLRVRLSNEFGTVPLRIGQAWVGLAAPGGGPALVPRSNHRLRFSGAGGVVVAAGGARWSDPVALRVGAGAQVAVSIHAHGQPVSGKNFPPYAAAPTGLFLSLPGAHAGDASGRAFPTATISLDDTRGDSPAGSYPGQAWWVDAIASDAPARGTVVVLGDSISEGYGAVGPPGQRASDILGARMSAAPAHLRMAVSNASISGDTLTVEPNPYMPPTDPYGCCGLPIPQRLGRDVLRMPGVRTVLVMAGTNDLAGAQYGPPVGADTVIAGYQALIRRLHADGLRVVGQTLIPMGLDPSNPREQARQQVNAWIRQRIGWDAVVDQDAALRDPAVPWRIMPAWESTGFVAPTGGVYHPNAAGHAVMAAAIRDSVLRG